MPQLDIYAWTVTLSFFVSFFFFFYFFFLYYLLFGIAKIFYSRKKFLQGLDVKKNIFFLELNFLEKGLFYDSFSVVVLERNQLWYLYDYLNFKYLKFCLIFRFFCYKGFSGKFFYELLLFYFKILRIGYAVANVSEKLSWMALEFVYLGSGIKIAKSK